LFAQCSLCFGIRVANGTIELFEPFFIWGKWGGASRGRVGSFHPCLDVFNEDFLHERFYVQFNVMSSLYDVNSVIEVEVALSLDWFQELIVD
jgi:hypothetical protein